MPIEINVTAPVAAPVVERIRITGISADMQGGVSLSTCQCMSDGSVQPGDPINSSNCLDELQAFVQAVLSKVKAAHPDHVPGAVEIMP